MSSRKSPTITCSEHAAALRELRRIPGVGPRIAQDFYAQGFRRVTELQGCDPQLLYERQCQCTLQGCDVDRCWLYVARCAVYFAQTAKPDPEKLKWWNWQDRR